MPNHRIQRRHQQVQCKGLCDYIFLTGYDIRRDRRKAGRLASIKVVFSDEYDEDDYTERDAEDLYSEIEKDVKETMSERRTK